MAPEVPTMASQVFAISCQRVFGSELIQVSARSVGWNRFSEIATTPETFASSRIAFTYSLDFPKWLESLLTSGKPIDPLETSRTKC